MMSNMKLSIYNNIIRIWNAKDPENNIVKNFEGKTLSELILLIEWDWRVVVSMNFF
jgi:hypothetical protein